MKKYGEVFYITWFWKSSIKCRFRIDPIPGTRGYRGYGTYFRRMKTTQERRMFFAYPDYTRGKRNMRNLPNSWDDWHRSDARDKCWKRI